MQAETTFFVEREEDDDYCEYELIIRGDVEPYVAANFRGHPDNWTPPEGGTRYIEGIFVKIDGVEKRWTGKLTKEEEEQAEEALFEAFKDSCEPDPDSGYDAYMDDCNDEWMDYIN
jgi:hypothetical protein